MRTFPQAVPLAGMSWEVDWQVVQACHGCSWLTHAGVVFESPKEGKRQGRHPHACSLVPRMAAFKQVTRMSLSSEPLANSIAFPKSSLLPTTAAGQIISSSGPGS